jgi:hypothetical protein
LGRLNRGGTTIKSISLPLDLSLPGDDGQSKLEKMERQARVDGYGNFSGLVAHLLEEWWTKFGKGNPGFTMDNFIGNPDFMAMPALMRDDKDWEAWLNKQNSKQFTEWDLKVNNLLRLSHKFNQLKFYDAGSNPNDG